MSTRDGERSAVAARPDPRGSAQVLAPARCRPKAAAHDCRCGCGSLLARLRPDGVELKCRRCKRVVMLSVRRSSRRARWARPTRSADPHAGTFHSPAASGRRAPRPNGSHGTGRPRCAGPGCWRFSWWVWSVVIPAQAGSEDALLKLLIRKGILTQEDVDALKREMAAEEAAQKAAPLRLPLPATTAAPAAPPAPGQAPCHRGAAERSRRAGPQRDPGGDGREGRGGDLDLGDPRG